MRPWHILMRSELCGFLRAGVSGDLEAHARLLLLCLSSGRFRRAEPAEDGLCQAEIAGCLGNIIETWTFMERIKKEYMRLGSRELFRCTSQFFFTP